MKARFFFFWIGSFLFLLGTNASDNYYFRHYTSKDGLSHNTVYCLLQDSKGFMWFGTEDGLNRFDGYSFQIFRYNYLKNKEGTLINDRILHFEEDASGRIWICTAGGVCYYDYDTDLFHPLILHTQTTPYFAEQAYEDKDGYIWLRDQTNITRYNPTNRSFKTFHAEEYGFRSVTMTLTEDGLPVFASATALFVYNPESDDFDRLVSIENYRKNEVNVICTIKEVPQVGFFIGTDLEGLWLYHTHTGMIESVIPETYIRAIMPYHTNTYWIASESGLYIYNLIDKSVVNLRKSLTNDYAIADNAVYSLTRDREGGVWVGSFFGGINYLPRNYTNFTYYIGGKTHPGMLGNTVREICPDQYGNLWLGTEDNGINRFDPRTNKMENYSLRNPVRKLSATNIHGLYAEGDTLWIGTFNQGIELLHIPTGHIFKQYTSTSTNGQLVSNFILCFCKTKNGDFLIGTSSGVVLYDRKNNAFSRWKGIDHLVRQILEDQENNIWVSTGSGLYKYTPPYIEKDGTEVAEKLVRYTGLSSSRSQGLGSSNTTSVFEDSKGRIWVTTTYGFSLYSKYTDSFNRITTDDGLPSNMIYRIEEDDDRLFWISTAKGLVRFDPETHVIHTYTYSDGLHEAQFNYSSSYKSPDGFIYMGTINGMISFHPKHFMRDTYVPPLYMTRIHVHDHPGQSQFLLKHTSDEPYILKLPYNSSTFTVSYIAPGYTSPDAIKYAYMLDGVDKEWIFMDKNKDVTFARLSPGEYTFRVRSTNSSDVWQQNEQTLQIVVMPPFWMTSWFYLVCVLVIVACLVLFYRYKKRNFFRKAQHHQELFEMEKEKELYNAKIQFFTFITHEIRTPLTLIKAPLEKIMHSGDGNEETKQNLDIIERNTQRLLDLSNQLLDFRKTESKGFRLNFVKTDTTLMMENMLVTFMSVFQNENKKLSVHLPEKHVFGYIDRNAFTKMVTNLFTNALKYSATQTRVDLVPPEESAGAGTVATTETVAAAETGATFRVVVTNDGPVVPEKERENIFNPFYRLKETENIQGSGIGLSLSRTLAEFHNGTLVYRETEQGWNQFILTLPVRQATHNFDLSEKPDIFPEEEAPVSGSDKSILLIVEDQADMRRFLVGELNHQYEIVEAEHGQEALHLLENKKVDLIISDIMMPVMDGFELCKFVKNNVLYSHLPFILLTAQHHLQSRLTGLSQGADAYLEKPFSLEHLFAQIKNLLHNREILRRSYQEKPFTPAISLAASSPVDDLFLKKLNAYIEDHIMQEMNVDTLANELNMSASSFYRKVKGLSGLSPVDYIRTARLKKAVQYMQAGEKRVREIAFLVGFSTPGYFSTTFQKQYGKSPSEFLKEMK